MHGRQLEELRAAKKEARKLARKANKYGTDPALKAQAKQAKNKYVDLNKKERANWVHERTLLLQEMTNSRRYIWDDIDKIINHKSPNKLTIEIKSLHEYYRDTFERNMSTHPLVLPRAELTDRPAESNGAAAPEDPKITITESDVIEALRNTKANKATGPDGIPPLLLTKMRLSSTFVKYITALYSRILELGIWPDEWNVLIINPILKPNKPPGERPSYRPIHICSAMAKLFAQIMAQKIQDTTPHCPEQMGFTKNYGTRDNAFVLNTIIDKYRQQGLYCAFVDFRAAFDTINRKKLINKQTTNLKMQPNVVNLIADMHSNVKAYIRGLSEPINENIGVKQGDPVGPQLFNLYIHDLPNHMHEPHEPQNMNRLNTKPVNLDGTIIKCLLYADDLVLFSTTAEGLQHQLNNLHAYCL